jgi:hypothetical protein
MKKGLQSFLAMPLKWNVQSALFLSVHLIVFLFILEWCHFIPQSGGSIKLNPIAGTGIEITYETSKGHSEKASVINVPAYRMATPTKVILHAGDTIEISSSGVTSTSSTYDWFSKSSARPARLDYANIMEEIKKQIFNRDADPNWRDSSGNRLSGLKDEDLSTDTPLQKAHDRWKLYTNGNYGLLLGCVLPHIAQNPTNLALTSELLKARKSQQIFPVGQKMARKWSSNAVMKTMGTNLGCTSHQPTPRHL